MISVMIGIKMQESTFDPLIKQLNERMNKNSNQHTVPLEGCLTR